MRRALAIFPSICLLGLFIYSLYLRSLGNHWVNYFVIGLTGTCVYSMVIIFIDGLVSAFQYEKPLRLTSKIFFTYFTVLAIVSITFSIYLMAHN